MNRPVVEIIPDPELGGFTARLPGIPAYGEGETTDEAIADLKIAVRAYLEAFALEGRQARNVNIGPTEMKWLWDEEREDQN